MDRYLVIVLTEIKPEQLAAALAVFDEARERVERALRVRLPTITLSSDMNLEPLK